MDELIKNSNDAEIIWDQYCKRWDNGFVRDDELWQVAHELFEGKLLEDVKWDMEH